MTTTNENTATKIATTEEEEYFGEIREIFAARDRKIAEAKKTIVQFPKGFETKKTTTRSHKNLEARIAKRNKKQNKLCEILSWTMSFISMVAVMLAAMHIVYNVWHPDFYDFLIIMMVIGFADLTFFGLAHEYIVDRIKNLSNSKR